MADNRMHLDWRAGIGAGLIAGLVFLIAEMILVPLALGGSPFGPVRMIGSIALGEEVLPPPATFDLGITVLALIVHFALSAIYGVLFSLAASRVGMGGALGIGFAFGIALYFINFFGFTAIFPQFEAARNWVTFIAHGIFGLVAAAAYKPMEGRAHATSGAKASA